MFCVPHRRKVLGNINNGDGHVNGDQKNVVNNIQHGTRYGTTAPSHKILESNCVRFGASTYTLLLSEFYSFVKSVGTQHVSGSEFFGGSQSTYPTHLLTMWYVCGLSWFGVGWPSNLNIPQHKMYLYIFYFFVYFET